MLNQIAIFCNLVELINRMYVKIRVIEIIENFDEIYNVVLIVNYFNINDVNC